MKPPFCHICNFRGNDECHIVYFALTEAMKKEQKEREPGFIEHPGNAEWFCEKHYEIAKNYVHLPLHQAMKEIRKDLEKT